MIERLVKTVQNVNTIVGSGLRGAVNGFLTYSSIHISNREELHIVWRIMMNIKPEAPLLGWKSTC